MTSPGGADSEAGFVKRRAFQNHCRYSTLYCVERRQGKLRLMSNPLLTALHDVASVGWVYDSIQFLAGAPMVRRRLRTHLSGCHGQVLDIGGGTGAIAELLPSGCLCTCLDNEMPKLLRCAGKGFASPLLADATRLPIQSGSIDAVTCVAMAHHLTNDQLGAMFRESSRVLKPQGSMIFLDPVFGRRACRDAFCGRWTEARIPDQRRLCGAPSSRSSRSSGGNGSRSITNTRSRCAAKPDSAR